MRMGESAPLPTHDPGDFHWRRGGRRCVDLDPGRRGADLKPAWWVDRDADRLSDWVWDHQSDQASLRHHADFIADAVRHLGKHRGDLRSLPGGASSPARSHRGTALALGVTGTFASSTVSMPLGCMHHYSL